MTTENTPTTDAVAILQAGLEAAAGPVALACSFSAEDVLLIDLVQERRLPVSIFALDTGRLPEETYAVAEALLQRYPGLRIAWYAPEAAAVEGLLRQQGPLSFYESLDNRKECCRIRKIEPLRRALAGQAGWITGLRRAHGATRSDLPPLERDSTHGGILKISPLIAWSGDQLWAAIEARRLPVNRLYRQGYASIGCAPCTRAIEPGEPPRAGRWWWEDPDSKECGLHK